MRLFAVRCITFLVFFVFPLEKGKDIICLFKADAEV